LKEIQKTTLLQKYSSGIWTYGRNDLEATTIKKYPVVGNALKLLKCFARMHNLPESCCRMSGTGGAVFCSTPTLSIATKISTHIKKIKEKEVIIKICQRLI
jgi:4-diphosphocytidyl-2C-methyl-D-erythritol kinase